MEAKLESERRKKFSTQISLGSIIATLSFAGAGIGVWTNLYADVKNLKDNEIKKELADRDYRIEMKQELRDVKSDVKDLNRKIDIILFEVQKLPKPPARVGDR